VFVESIYIALSWKAAAAKNKHMKVTKLNSCMKMIHMPNGKCMREVVMYAPVMLGSILLKLSKQIF